MRPSRSHGAIRRPWDGADAASNVGAKARFFDVIELNRSRLRHALRRKRGEMVVESIVV